MPFGNIWLSPNAFKTVIVFASFAFCIRYARAVRLLRPLYLVYNVSVGLQLKWFHTICLRCYHVFVRQPHRHITRLQKDNRFHRHRFRTGPARTGRGRVPFFGNHRICRLGIRLQSGSICRIYCKKRHTRDIYAGDAFYHNTGNLFGTVGTCLVPHPFAAAYSYYYAAENLTPCRNLSLRFFSF